MAYKDIGFNWDGEDGNDGGEEMTLSEEGMYFPEINVFVSYHDLLRYAAVGLMNTLTLQGERVRVELIRVNQVMAQTQISYGSMNYLLINNLTTKSLDLEVKLTEILTLLETLSTEVVLRGWL
ncbi:hypothetical protein SAMN05660649_04339 [Desulfotomaculum arcticum]|uniref:Uncharacterized protein n=1 Tax=Desulfotruncus arcticus DSM 17038 TaxID=1121424 RepID=A0A1I2YAX6_9FIRM|nr:hypothetical protein [Desulfotruncus arcticus]SFH22519.1 hypothetical protein SAMN05660649_04339 [Desulfotomaculum arcticum] [Desulfotruncus arcticus DSM 17038]